MVFGLFSVFCDQYIVLCRLEVLGVLPKMPKGVKCETYSDAEQMDIARKYLEWVVPGIRRFSAVQAFVQWQFDGGHRHRSRHLKEATVIYWAEKVDNGDAPGDDLRRYYESTMNIVWASINGGIPPYVNR